MRWCCHLQFWATQPRWKLKVMNAPYLLYSVGLKMIIAKIRCETLKFWTEWLREFHPQRQSVSWQSIGRERSAKLNVSDNVFNYIYRKRSCHATHLIVLSCLKPDGQQDCHFATTMKCSQQCVTISEVRLLVFWVDIGVCYMMAVWRLNYRDA